jgi:hypothetical protein
MSRFRWKLWAIPTVLIVMGFVIISNGAVGSNTSTCQTKTTSPLRSPDGAWAATIQEVLLRKRLRVYRGGNVHRSSNITGYADRKRRGF